MEKHLDSSASTTRISLGKRIRKLRKSQGISLRRFSLMVGLSYPYLSRVENGKVAATIDVLERIAEGLDVPIKELF